MNYLRKGKIPKYQCKMLGSADYCSINGKVSTVTIGTCCNEDKDIRSASKSLVEASSCTLVLELGDSKWEVSE